MATIFQDFLYILEHGGEIYCADCEELIDLEQTFATHELDNEEVEATCESCADKRLEDAIRAGRLFECVQCGVTQGIEELSHQDQDGQLCVSCDSDRWEFEAAWEAYNAERRSAVRSQWHEVAQALDIDLALIVTADGVEMVDLQDLLDYQERVTVWDQDLEN